METTLNISLTVSQLATLLRQQLPKKDRQKLISLLQDEEELTKTELKAEIRQAVQEVNLIKKGKLKARPIQDLLDEL
ncbi:hypothetical protein [Larkinella sp.]|uniref:hypothetical protein n=1 Tax=Larkinella sp. TaxID=2034517 RepID=UPI003BACAB17